MTAPALEARGLTRRIAAPLPVTLVEDIDVAFRSGEFAAVTGPSGSGKSSLLYLLGLLDTPSEGTVLLAGRDTAGLDRRRRAALRLSTLGFVFQFHFLLPEFTARENILIPMRKLGRLPAAAREERAEALLVQLGLENERDKLPDQMSGGQRQRVAIARALANDPPVLLADEPTGNLDTRNAHNVFEIFRRLAHEEGRTVVTVTHDTELAALTDRQVHLVDGRIT
jgi:lipoprotein-releasing system ATP-binding protein